MKIAILGAGMIASTLGRHWANAGHHVLFGVRQPDRVEGLVAEIGPNAAAGSLSQAAGFGAALVFAAPFSAWPEFAQAQAKALEGRVVIDAANPIGQRDGAIVEAVTRMGAGSGVYTASLLPRSHVVKAFNTMYWVELRDQANHNGGRLAMPIVGDEKHAVRLVADLVDIAGFDPVIVGPMNQSALLDPGGPGYSRSMTATQLRQALGLQPTANV